MKDLSREERLERQILQMAEEYGKRKWQRVKRTFFVICSAIYLIELYIILTDGISDVTFDIICAFLFAPPVAAGFIMYASMLVLLYILNGSLAEEKAIAKKMGELEAIKYIKHE